MGGEFVSRSIITLTTDFGQSDGYVGTMKGVILGICPEASLVDISHEIRPQAVRQAAFVISAAAPYFPEGTVHLVVVDPGVGSERRPIVVRTERGMYVAPDNGVLSLALEQDPAQEAIHLTEARFQRAQVSATFHGRDIFAPAAAHLARGAEPNEMGARLDPTEIVRLSMDSPQRLAAGLWQGQVLHIDRFGNLISDLRLGTPTPGTLVRVGQQWLGNVQRTFADVAPGEMVAYMGSSGYLEIAVREGSAARALGMDIGDPIQVEKV
jgi:S-adenosylmethionine hydrolase